MKICNSVQRPRIQCQITIGARFGKSTEIWKDCGRDSVITIKWISRNQKRWKWPQIGWQLCCQMDKRKRLIHTFDLSIPVHTVMTSSSLIWRHSIFCSCVKKDNEDSPIIKFLINSSVSNFWNHKTSNDLIISSISGVCHLSSTDISLLDTRFHHLANYSDYLKCDEITDGLAKYIPYDIAHGLVTWFDVNDDAKIDFKGNDFDCFYECSCIELHLVNGLTDLYDS